MNLILALIAAVVFGIAKHYSTGLAGFADLVLRINVGLMIFNLIPIPPLDGSKFLMYWFGMREETYMNFARFGWIILLVLINIPQTRFILGLIYTVAIIPFYGVANLL